MGREDDAGMSNQEKKLDAESTASVREPVKSKIDDPPPPYTPPNEQIPSTDPKPPPPLPSQPPALTQEPLPDREPQIVRSRSPQMTDEPAYPVWETCKAVCCMGLCWTWTKCVYCVESGTQMCCEQKPRRNR